jgi:hypothetical protein
VRELSSNAAVPLENAETANSEPPARLALVTDIGVGEAKLRWTLQCGFVGRLGGQGAVISRRELTALRGRVFYAQGRRPQFLTANGEFADEDEHDSVAFHLIGSSGDQPVAACRLVRFPDVATTDFERRVGSEAIERIIGALRIGRGDVAELSRWVVDPRFRHAGLGAQLIAGMWALAAHLRTLVGVAWAGTRDGQARALVAMGGSPISGVERIKSEAWDDELQALSFELDRPAPRFQSWVARMRKRLGLREMSWARR